MTDKSTETLRTPESLLEDLGARLTRRRIELNLTQADLAKQAGVGKRTLERLEAGGSTQLTNFLRILRELDLLTDFMSAIPEDRPSPMELLRSRKHKPRQRVRYSKSHPDGNSVVREEATGWTWAE